MSLLATSFGLAATRHYRAFRAHPSNANTAASVLHQIRGWATTHRLAPFGAVVDGDAVGVLASAALPPKGPTVGLGPAVELHRVHESYRVAEQMIEVGLEFGRTGPQTMERLSPLVAVASEHGVGDSLVDRLLGPLLAQGDFGRELVASLDAFLTANMNTAAAADMLVVHPNTLRYRINQVKRLCGLDLLPAREISETWWALRRHEWSERKNGRTHRPT